MQPPPLPCIALKRDQQIQNERNTSIFSESSETYGKEHVILLPNLFWLRTTKRELNLLKLLGTNRKSGRGKQCKADAWLCGLPDFCVVSSGQYIVGIFFLLNKKNDIICYNFVTASEDTCRNAVPIFFYQVAHNILQM